MPYKELVNELYGAELEECQINQPMVDKALGRIHKEHRWLLQQRFGLTGEPKSLDKIAEIALVEDIGVIGEMYYLALQKLREELAKE